MNYDNPGRTLKNFLESHGSALGTSATDEEILRFESGYGVKLSNALRTYFTELNGTQGEYGYGIVRFWSVAEACPLKQVVDAVKPGAAVIQAMYKESYDLEQQLFVFADYLHESQLYAVRISPTEGSESIVLLDGEKPSTVAHDFSDFVNKFINTPQDLRIVED